ncbi:hypothetical protein LTR62_001629 [Meristemomyces frigidus]|uniref:NOL1/NOP2/Sun domain family member 4 n=1 Tax=Meristemomyces frigidus TaxID=1508187 RepID=A0AAN7TFL4_9PEZI|nr:hypothetical protein LTR62_001629 [Meristemomyces frigidus]
MTKTTRSFATPAEEPFHKHFVAIYGEDRWWKTLYLALSEPTRYAAVVNQYAMTGEAWLATQTTATGTAKGLSAIDDSTTVRLAGQGFVEMKLPRLSTDVKEESGILCFCKILYVDASQDEKTSSSKDFPQPTLMASQYGRLQTHWNLDGASALVAHLLDVNAGDSVLDLCAAPGGKSVALSQLLWPSLHAKSSATSTLPPSRLLSNEADPKRHKRLASNLQAYLPAPLLKSSKILTTNIDAATSASSSHNALMSGGAFDKVLVDAPCSSERHIIHSNDRSSWRAGTSKRLAKTQVELLMTALKAVRIGGNVMYATCSLEPMENDGVIEKVLASVEKEAKKGGWKWGVELDFVDGDMEAQLAEQLRLWAEPTNYGWIVLPDHPEGGGLGPLYFCRVTKVSRT